MEIILVIVGIFWFIGALTGTSKKTQEAVRQRNMDELVEHMNNEYRNN